MSEDYKQRRVPTFDGETYREILTRNIPHLDKAVRVEDLKITHRLLDIVSALTEPRP